MIPLLAFLFISFIPKEGFTANTRWELVDETVADVNGEPVLLSDVKLYELLFGENDFKRALNKVIDIYLAAQYAQEKGVEIPPQRVSKIVEKFAKSQGISVARLYAELQKFGLGGAVFQNFIEKYNLYVAAIQLFVLKPLHENKEQLELLVAAHSPQAKTFYTFEIVKVPKKEALKYEDLLVEENLNKIAQAVGTKPLKLTSTLDALKPQIAKVLKRLKPGKVDFAEDKNYLYVIKLDKIEYRTPEGSRDQIIKQIEQEKIEQFLKELRQNAVVKILPEAFPKEGQTAGQ